MKRAASLAFLLLACTRTTELLGPAPVEAGIEAPTEAGIETPPQADALPDVGRSTPDALPYCPTTIDVFGGTNVSLLGCGGPQLAPAPLENGYFAPGVPDYDASLAGRIYARLVGDPDLVPRFGSVWTVRSCSAPGGSLSQLTPALAEDDCGADNPNGAGALQDVCANNPAPITLLSAGMQDDLCHGGGPDSNEADDQTTYVQHFTMRLDNFLNARSPSLALIGPTSEWTATPSHDGSFVQGCLWTRPDWDQSGLAQWTQDHPDDPRVSLVPDLHADFERHNRCCRVLGLDCDTNFSSELGVVNCDGAQAIVDLWYQSLKAVLLAQTYDCPPPKVE